MRPGSLHRRDQILADCYPFLNAKDLAMLGYGRSRLGSQSARMQGACAAFFN
jgi:hypothetical protein